MRHQIISLPIAAGATSVRVPRQSVLHRIASIVLGIDPAAQEYVNVSAGQLIGGQVVPQWRVTLPGVTPGGTNVVCCAAIGIAPSNPESLIGNIDPVTGDTSLVFTGGINMQSALPDIWQEPSVVTEVTFPAPASAGTIVIVIDTLS